jgi:hypothetical protein
LDGDFPENRLVLAELWDKLRKTDLLTEQLRAMEARWQNAKRIYQGPEWELSWKDWEKRRSLLLAKSERRR